MAFKFKRDRGEEVEITSKDILGMTEDEVKEKFGSLDGLRTAVTEQGTTLEGLKAGVDVINQKFAEFAKRGGGHENNNEEPEVDPVVRMSATALQLSMESKIDNIKRKLRDRVDATGKLMYPYWDQFEADMDKLTEKDQLASKTSEVYWSNAYDIIVGRNIEKIKTGEIKTRKTFFSEPGGNSPSHTEKTDVNKPSEIDIKQAEKFKIPIEKYMATKGKMTFVS